MRRILVTFTLFAALAGGGALAAEPPRPYQSPMRSQCEAELGKDKVWQAELRESVRPAVHQEDADTLIRNHQHVVIAYGALWGLTVVFLVLLYLRQRRLVGELDELEQKIKKAAAE